MENEKPDLGLYQDQLSTYVSFTSVMIAVCVFFVGFLLASFHSYDTSIKVPISFLIIALFSFLYSTLIYTGASAEVTLQNHKKFLRATFLGDAISEYLGVYLLVCSIPLTINAITTDSFLRGVTLISAAIGLIVYQTSHISMVEVHFPRRYLVMSLIAVLLLLLIAVGQMFNFHFTLSASIFLIFVLTMTYSATRFGLKKVSQIS